MQEQVVLLRGQERREQDRADDERNARAPQRRLHRMGMDTLVRAAPVLAEILHTEVPAEFWTVTGERTAMISCPCGAEPVVGYGELVACDGADCGRYYLYTGPQMRVGKVDPGAAEDDS